MKRFQLAIALALALTAAIVAGSARSAPAQRSAATAPLRADAVRGGTLTIGLYQEPDNLNPFLAVQTASRLVRELVLEGLVDSGPGNSYRPQLATVVPTVKNGGISKNGLRVTYRLRPNLKWSDGHPLTSADVKFTWQSVMNKANKVNSQAGYDQIRSVATPNSTTVVITFKKLYAPAMSLFSIPDAVLPAHALRGKPFNGASFSRSPRAPARS